MLENVLKKPGFWSGSGPYNDVVLSSRIRLARNIKSLPFSNRMSDGEVLIIKNIIDKFSSSSIYAGKIIPVNLKDIDSNEKRILRERNLITYEMEIAPSSFVLIDSEDDFTILVNDEDHLRIQVIKPGLQLLDSYRLANDVDDELNRFVPYAFSDEYGYLSACPSNLGTGLRASVMVHLPVLTIKQKMHEIVPRARKTGVEIRGTIGENNRTLGSIYQISNRTSLGMSVIDIIEKLDHEITAILDQEDRERDEFFSASRPELEDKIWRSFGILKFSRKMSYVESMEHLSNLRLGVIFAVIKKLDIHNINSLMVNIQWSHLQRHYEKIFRSTMEGDQARAEYLRANLD